MIGKGLINQSINGNIVFVSRLIIKLARGGAVVARLAHNQKVVGAIPTPARIYNR